MSEEQFITPEHTELETALGSLRPQAPRVNRDAMMFKAGQRHARRSHRLWQGLAGGLALLLCASLLVRLEPRQVERVRYVQADQTQAQGEPDAVQQALAPAPSQEVEPLRPVYLTLRQAVLEHGLDALPPATTAGRATRDNLELNPADFGASGRMLRTWRNTGGEL